MNSTGICSCAVHSPRLYSTGQQTGKGAKGSSHALIGVLAGHLPGVAEENHKKSKERKKERKKTL
jgi:hypothetical protein